MILGITKSVLVLDAETGSPTQLGAKGRGGANYWADPRTRVYMFGWKWLRRPDLPPGVADFETPEAPVRRLPPDVLWAIQAPPSECMLAAYNSEFDRNVLARLGYPTPPEKWFDVMVLAYMLGFSGGLDNVLKQIGLPAAKHPRGSRCITVFSKQFHPWWHDPGLWQDFRDYCRDDARIEEMLLDWVLRRLDTPMLRPSVQRVLPQELIYRQINMRGVPANPLAIAGAQSIMEREKEEVIARMKGITGLSNPNSRDQLLKWCRSQGSEMLDVRKETVVDEIQCQTAHLDSLSEDTQAAAQRRRIRDVLEMRQIIGKTSTEKYHAMARHLCGWDNRLRDLWQFFGASRTGRVAGRILNPANLARPMTKHADLIIKLIETGNYELLTLLYPRNTVLELLSWCIRASLKAPPGKLWCVADLTSIESVGLAWLAGCQKILDIFHEGRDTYKTFASEATGKPYDEITKEERTFYKPGVLGSGYQASGVALVDYAKGMGVELSEGDANRQVAVFRETYHEIPHYWANLQAAMQNAVRYPGRTFSVYPVAGWTEHLVDPTTDRIKREYTYKDWPRVDYYCDKEFLYAQLPSGRFLTYYKPSLKDKTIPKRDGTSFTVRDAVHYWGNNSNAAGVKWTEISPHGGHTAENNTQAVCRDILWWGLEQAEADPGLEVIGDVYDEVMTLCGAMDKDALSRLISYMTSHPPWMDDNFFLGADGYIAPNYRKD